MNNTFLKYLCLAAVLLSLPLTLQARRGGPDAGVSGAPGERTCRNCHQTYDTNLPPGFVRLTASNYLPNQTQRLKVTVSHPEAVRWGFQITARFASDLTKKAGTLIPNEVVQVKCTGNIQGPCEPNANEYASHVLASTEGGSAGAKTWEVDWTPPATDLGDVVFYVAGNAANGNDINTGDRIYLSQVRIENEGNCGLSTIPRFTSAGNAATSMAAISSNSLVSLYGLDFGVTGTSRTADAGVIRDAKFPKQLGCIGVEIAGQRVPITYTSYSQINAQVPTTNQTGSVPIKVILNPDRPNQLSSQIGNINLQSTSPALFTFAGGSIKAQHTDYTLAADPTAFPGARMVRPGDIVLLYATGLGLTEPVYQAGEIVPLQTIPTRQPVTVQVGGVTLPAADVLYAGIAPGSISGLYQINIRVPNTVAAGNIPVVVTVGGTSSPAGATLPIAAR
jgi:uncharacterized protein (TIGR03437 family)